MERKLDEEHAKEILSRNIRTALRSGEFQMNIKTALALLGAQLEVSLVGFGLGLKVDYLPVASSAFCVFVPHRVCVCPALRFP